MTTGMRTPLLLQGGGVSARSRGRCPGDWAPRRGIAMSGHWMAARCRQCRHGACCQEAPCHHSPCTHINTRAEVVTAGPTRTLHLCS
jgi:hypothetical protein